MTRKRISGLNDRQAAHARTLIKKGTAEMVRRRDYCHYSQGPSRWQGIDKRMTITRKQVPAYSDCSSSSTWLLWDAIARTYGRRDLVNGQNWRAGYTGTQISRGKRVRHDKNIKVGDLVFYGDQGGGVPKHVAVALGGGKVFSQGSEGGPYILNIDYRPDRVAVRRYI